MKKTIIALVLLTLTAPLFADTPETVLVTYQPKAGKVAEVEQLLRTHWSTVQRLGMVVEAAPHIVYRDGNKVVEILTWKGHEVPDNAPEEVVAIWNKLNAAVVKGGLEFHEVEPIR